MRTILAILTFLALVLFSGCQAPLQIVPSTLTPTPTGQAGLEEVPAASATIAVTTTTAATATPTLQAASATPTTTATQPASPTPTVTAAATRTPAATSQPTNTATVRSTNTATVRPTQTATALARMQRLTPTPTRQQPTATRRPLRASPSVTPRVSPTRTRQLPTATRRPPTRTPTPARINIEMTEAQLNKSVREAIAKDPSTPVRSISIDTQSGKVVINAQARLGFFNVNIEITVVVEVRNGKATPVIQEIKVNGSPATGFVRQQVEAVVQPYLNQIADISKNIYVESVTITDGGLKIQGRPR